MRGIDRFILNLYMKLVFMCNKNCDTLNKTCYVIEVLSIVVSKTIHIT